MIYVNKQIENFIVTETNDLHLAKTAVALAQEIGSPEVNITEKDKGVTTRYANVRREIINDLV